MGALRVPAETRVHERLHADQGGSARDHVRKPTGEVLHSGEFMPGFVQHLFYTFIKRFKMLRNVWSVLNANMCSALTENLGWSSLKYSYKCKKLLFWKSPRSQGHAVKLNSDNSEK